MFQIEHIKSYNPLENHYQIIKNDLSVKIYPHLGASIQELIKNGVSIIKGFKKVEDYKTQHTSSILFPFPGRIEHGKYKYRGKEYQLEPNEQHRNNAIHGLVAHQSFELIESTAMDKTAILIFEYKNEKTLEGYPFFYNIKLIYNISPERIILTFKIENLSTKKIPFGLGWHPYFYCPKLEDDILKLSTTKEIICDTEMIPIDEKSIDFNYPLKIDNQHFDTCYTMDDNLVSIQTKDFEATIKVLNEEQQYIQIFTPASRDCIALEPMTCAPNAFNNKMGLLELKPKSIYNYTVKLSFETK